MKLEGQALDSTEGFALVLAGLKAFLEAGHRLEFSAGSFSGRSQEILEGPCSDDSDAAGGEKFAWMMTSRRCPGSSF